MRQRPDLRQRQRRQYRGGIGPARFGGYAIVLNSTSGDLIEGNYLGTNVGGTVKLANSFGLDIEGGATANTVGGTTANLISGNSSAGIVIDGVGTSGNVVLGNFIGTQTNGTVKLGNGVGIELGDGATANTVGGITTASGNSVGGTGPGGPGGNSVGGTTAVAGNVISSNTQEGILLTGSGTSGNVVLGNFIGTDNTASVNLGNTVDGVLIRDGASANTIGGTVTGSGNTIAFNAKGVVVIGNATVGDSILENSIFQNTGPGIDLGDDGPTANGTNPPFPNDGQNTPLLTSSTSTSASGTLTGTAGTYRIEVFAYPSTDTMLEGKSFLGSTTVTIATSGATTTFTVAKLKIPAGMFLSATATNMTTGDTSEFARLDSPYMVNTVKDVLGDTKHLANGTAEVTLRDVLTAISKGTASGNAPAPGTAGAVIFFAIGASGSVQTINLTSPLPDVSLPTTIDGLTQGGSGYSGVPLIVLNGAKAGTSAIGLDFEKGSDGSTVEGLVLQSFGGDGIKLNATSGNLITGNYIGTTQSGKGKLGNGIGVLIESGASANTVGGRTTNLISGNSAAGVEISGTGTSGNVVFNNYIGTNKNGLAKLANTADGVLINDGATANTIGNAKNANILSGNRASGIEIVGTGTSANLVIGNFIGTDKNGLVSIGNANAGVLIDGGATANTIGSSTVPNVLSGNSGNGVEIKDAGTSDNVILNCFIGTDVNGTSRLANGRDGVLIDGGATANTVGDTVGNVLSANIGQGVEIKGTGTSNNVVFDNYIGTQKNGIGALGNSHNGVLIDGGATNNTIGSTTGGNLVSGNADNGVSIKDQGTSGNVVLDNYIGTQNNGTAALGNSKVGVLINGGATANTIGSSAGSVGNVISGNVGDGVEVGGSGTSANVVLGNFIGTDANGTAALGNTSAGVLIDSGATANTIGGTVSGSANRIAFNAKGVVVTGNTTLGDSILGNSIFSNKGLGIDLGNDGPTANGTNPRAFPNDGQNFPTLVVADSSTITATLTSAPGTYRVEFFDTPSSGPALQGETFLGFVTLTIASGDTSGSASLTNLTIASDMKVTATATNTGTGDTSEFS